MARRRIKPTVYGGWYETERKVSGYRLRVHRAGHSIDLVSDLKAIGSLDARTEAAVVLAREGIKTDPGYVTAYTEYWNSRYRKWVVSEVIHNL